MDVTSPFFVVPLMAVLFLGCILYGTLTDKERFDDTVPDESGIHPDTH